MFEKRQIFISICILFLLCFTTLNTVAQTQTGKSPYDKELLLKVVRLNALSTKEVALAIKQRGVNFQITDAVNTEFQRAGARPELIEAMRRNYRAPLPVKTEPREPTKEIAETSKEPEEKNSSDSGKPANVPPGAPLSKNEIIAMLQGGVAPSRVEQFIEARGVTFSITPEIAREITAAGGNRSLLGAITEVGVTEKPNPASTPATPAEEATKGSTTLSYDDLTDLATAAMQDKNSNYAITLLQKAVKLDDKNPLAYQLLGFAFLYGTDNFAAAESAMRAALERGGAAAFQVIHDHDGFFGDHTKGTLFVTKAGVTYKADDGKDTFEATAAQIKGVDINDFVGVVYGAFHLKVIQGKNKKPRTFNFAPATKKKEEAQLAISLIKG
jgi:hypothetical protein